MRIKTLKTKIILVLVLFTLTILILVDSVYYIRHCNILKQDLRNQLMSIAQMGALLIDGDTHAAIPLDASSRFNPNYLKIQKTLQQIKKLNKNIRYVYTMVPSSKPRHTKFVVDASVNTPEELPGALRSYPGDEFDATNYPALLNGFHEPSADKKFLADPWKALFSGYAPIKTAENQTVGLLGVDMDVKQVAAVLNRIKKEIIFSLILGLCLSILLGLLFSKLIYSPINKLIKDIRYITKTKDLKHKIELKTADELEELAANFNLMTETLQESQQQHRRLILNVIQSLTLALEANEPFMNGHSQRVTNLAELVGEKLNLPEKEIEIIKEIGLVHDIGKLAINSTIVAKTTELTQEEWNEIKRHPIEGEKILAPILLLEPELSLIRSHHERYDGKGYPDGLKGDEISLMVAILTLADAFDAMISPRPYRPRPFSKPEALAEIQRCSGIQFNPQVVEAFVALYNENKI